MNTSNKIKLAAASLFFGVSITSAIAFQKTAPPPEQTKKTEDQQFATFQADEGFDTSSKTGISTGNKITYIEKDMVVHAKYGKYNKKTKELFAEDNLSLDDAKQHITADKIHVFDEPSKKLAVLTGNVIIKVKPSTPKPEDPKASITTAPVTPPSGAKPAKIESDKPEQRGNITVYSEVAEYSYKKKMLLLKGHVKFVQIIKDDDGKETTRTLLADRAEYDMNAEKMVIYPDPVMTDTDGAEAHFSGKLYIGTKEGEETLKGTSFTSKFPIKEEEETPPPPKKKR